MPSNDNGKYRFMFLAPILTKFNVMPKQDINIFPLILRINRYYFPRLN